MFSPRTFPTMTANKIAAGNAGWPFQFRFAVHDFWPHVPEL